jgi:hypothetical protein
LRSRLGQRCDQVIHPLEVIVLGALDPAGKVGDIEHFCARAARDGFRGPAIQVRLDENDARLLLLHAGNDPSQVGRGDRQSRFGFEEHLDLQTEAPGEIRPGIVIGHHVPPLKRRQQLLPFRHLGGQTV